MPTTFNTETFRDDYTFANSPEAVRRFPFPFDRDWYTYSVNIEPHTPGPVGSVTEFPIDIDEHYRAEMADRAIVLAEDPMRCQASPHMELASWDLLELVMTSLAGSYPGLFALSREGDRWHWRNRPLGLEQSFTFGDSGTLPLAPLEYVGRQCQGDFCLMDQRDGQLWLDAGILTTQIGWSLDFDLGMNFSEWHAPVPLAGEAGVFDRALKFLRNLQYGQPVRRLNWSVSVNARLDNALETLDVWGPAKSQVTLETMGRMMHLRVELQALWRLPRSHAVAFSIRTYLLKFDELATQPRWATRFRRVLTSLPPELIEYKGLARTRDMMVDWLAREVVDA